MAGPEHGSGPETPAGAIPDARISKHVRERLDEDPHLEDGAIDIDVKDGEVTLSGLVDHPHDKQRAEECAGSVRGVVGVRNNLRARPHPVPPQSDLA